MSSTKIICGKCLDELKKITEKVDMTFLDPPFNQQKDYSLHNDNMPEEQYWEMMKSVCKLVYDITKKGGCVYFMQRENGIYVTDVWDDIRELTSGYFAGDEAIRTKTEERFHKQQTSLALLLRLILSSTKPNDTVLDPFAGTGTTIVTALQLQRKSITIEIDPQNVDCIQNRIRVLRDTDILHKYYKDYICTENLASIWGSI